MNNNNIKLKHGNNNLQLESDFHIFLFTLCRPTGIRCVSNL